MEHISIAERILEERSRNGLTQEELARQLGVSKAAVSKWECRQSMPDIALLPKIASLFSITIDQLFGYEPIASEEKREGVRAQLLALLEQDEAEACDYVEEQVALHWSDPELLRVVALTLCAKAIEPSALNYGNRDREEPRLAELAEKSLRRTLQLEPEGPSSDLALQALCMLLTSEGKEEQAAEIIQGMVPVKPNTAAITLAGIKVQTGDAEGAQKTLKRQILCSLIEAMSCAQTLAGLQDLGIDDLEQLLALVEGMQAPRGFAAISPTPLPIIRLAFATRLVEAGHTKRALDELQRFALDLDHCCTTIGDPRNPPFFQCAQDLLWEEGDERTEAARSDAAATLRASLVGSIASDISWGALRGDPKFDEIMSQLESREETA